MRQINNSRMRIFLNSQLYICTGLCILFQPQNSDWWSEWTIPECEYSSIAYLHSLCFFAQVLRSLQPGNSGWWGHVCHHAWTYERFVLWTANLEAAVQRIKIESTHGVFKSNNFNPMGILAVFSLYHCATEDHLLTMPRNCTTSHDKPCWNPFLVAVAPNFTSTF